ncbi:ABC transporter permease [Paenibacillus mucilaginosus]|uniref:Bacitracin transport permease BcrB n=3 Tax=Paenibacillus mucilaginosus TaxID=61624 RepID=H6NGP2_9BACL|nr:ABC transporter permease [Paenibacillus mucilaginosus]AEI46344.1 bacitracin transport permease protein BcrB [Paenibacillus mucilaginosus KNP414]AFC33945.1 bacitracin transport permease BcrB [Paenibacillus mucilaginosus 3016]AFH66279.1 ABC transporter permease [Paenibacillus mucilaginosus K02]MCG7213542.1 ABC transporter permease [Paenibacillus mucilaginosus]WDM27642.1 ABC transporter permease [Paenibacillus mucilaginosus]
MINLVYNEMLKLTGKRKLLVVTLIIAVLISLFTYAQYRQGMENLKRFGNVDWRTAVQQQISNWENRLNSGRVPEASRAELQIRIAQQQYYLDADVNPALPGAPTFVRNFVENATTLLLPLMMMVIASDIVSSEHSAGTVKVLLTRPVRRWRILLSKYLALTLAVSFIILMFGLLSALISGAVFGFQGWGAPVLTGFSASGGELDASRVHSLPQWQYIAMEMGLAWFVSLVVATLSFMLSVLIRSTAAGMGIMLACLIAGVILKEMVASWESAKYLFMVNLELIDYLEDAAPPIEGMSLGFSLLVLLAWGAAGLLVSFVSFTRRDVY